MGMVVSSLSILNKFDDVIEQVRRRPIAADSCEQLSEMIHERGMPRALLKFSGGSVDDYAT
jgi:hypothetical protein